MVKIFIDPGHGGTDPGASANGLQEKQLTLIIAKKIAAKLAGYNKVQTKLSRTADTTLSLAARTKMANDWQADFLLSVHVNAGGGTGYEDFIYSGGVGASTKQLRDTIHAEIIKQLSNVRNRGKKRANFHMLRESRMPAMLSENLFIDTSTDASLLKTDNFLEKIALGHVNGLSKAFNLKKKSNTAKPSKPTESTDNKTFYRVIAGSYNNRENANAQVARLKQLGIEAVFIDIFKK